MTPALHTRTSRRGSSASSLSADAETADRSARSHCIKEMRVSCGAAAVVVQVLRALEMVVSADAALRPVKRRWDGAWRASCMTASAPIPVVPRYLVRCYGNKFRDGRDFG
jgi:hypothetical protein